MACACIDSVNAQLAPEHELDALYFLTDRPVVPRLGLRRRDNFKLETRSGKRSSMSPTFCPFCGLRYIPEEPAAELITGGTDAS